MKNYKRFTLIEMLIVVLIIAILAAIALPQYRKATERSIMAEAVTLVNQITQANQRYYMATGAYAAVGDLDALDIRIDGSVLSDKRVQTKNFIYSPGGAGSTVYLAVANRGPYVGSSYWLYTRPDAPTKIRCAVYASGHSTAAQKEICEELDAKGTL